MTRTITIVVLALLGIFVHPFSPGTIDFIYRFLIFSALTYLVYLNFRREESEPDSMPAIQTYTPSIPKSDIDIEINTDISFMGVLKKDSRTADYINSQFEILFNILVAEKGWIFHKDNSETIRVIRSAEGDNHIRGNPVTTYQISGLMQILNSEDKVLIENSLNNDTPLLNYYTDSEYNPLSFIGVPIELYGDEKIFFVFDSPNKDHFNHEDVNLVERIQETTKIFLINRMKGYTLLSSLRAKNSLLEFATTLNGSKNISHAVNKLAEYVSELFEATRMTICLKKSDSTTGVVKKVVGQTNDIEENFEFPLDQGLTGWVIAKNKPYLIEDLEKGEYFIPRYTKDEKTNFGLRSFIGVPLQTSEKVYGALTLEHIIPGKFTEEDKHRIQQITEIFSSTFLRQQS
jgi:transcriptional regulator with GAF, ATPase, and Fis domain